MDAGALYGAYRALAMWGGEMRGKSWMPDWLVVMIYFLGIAQGFWLRWVAWEIPRVADLCRQHHRELIQALEYGQTKKAPPDGGAGGSDDGAS